MSVSEDDSIMSVAFRYAQLLHLDYYRMVSQVPSSESHDTIGLCAVVVVVVVLVVVAGVRSQHVTCSDWLFNIGSEAIFFSWCKGTVE
jgi:hypothetical protein